MRKHTAIFLNIQKIKSWLSLKGWSQRDFAGALKCDESMVSRWLTPGDPQCPSDIYKERICILTGLDISDILCIDRKKVNINFLRG